MASTDKRALQGRIFGACKMLGLDEDTRKDLQKRVTGKTSTKAMTRADMELVLVELKNQGWTPATRKKAKGFRPAAQRPDQRFVFVLWRLLADAGVVDPGVEPLRRFIASKNFEAKWGEAMTDPNMMSAERCYDVIEALKAVAARNGVSVERP